MRTLDEATKKRLADWDQLKIKNRQAWSDEMRKLASTDEQLHCLAIRPHFRPKEKAAPAPPAPTEPPPDFLTRAEYHEKTRSVMQIAGKATNDFVHEYVEKQLAPIRERQNSMADASRVAELQTQVQKMQQQLSAANKENASLRRRVDQLFSEFAKK